MIAVPPGPETQLTIAEMKALLTELNAEREQDPLNIDIRALQSFIDLLSAALPRCADAARRTLHVPAETLLVATWIA